MDRLTAIPLRIGAWRIDPRTGQLSREGETVRVEARTLRLLLHLAQRAGEVVSQEELLEQVWSGVVVTPDSVYQGVASLRRILGDDPKQPTYIATVPRLGYRMVARVSLDEGEALTLPAGAVPSLVAPSVEVPEPADAVAPHGVAPPPLAPSSVVVPKPADPVASAGAIPGDPSAANPTPTAVPASAPAVARRPGPILAAMAVVALIALAILFLFNSKLLTRSSSVAQVPPRSVAVLPFLDLTTEAMNEEYFADGMTEELINQLARVPDLRVPSPTSSFYFKGKQATVADIAKSLGVAYVLDGSVRKSDATLRISARLIRAADGYVVWAETYDRPEGDKLWVQEDISSQVTKALRAAIR